MASACGEWTATPSACAAAGDPAEPSLLGAYTRRARRNARQTLQRMFVLFPRLEECQQQAAGILSGGE